MSEVIKQATERIRQLKKERELADQEAKADTEASMLAFQMAMHDDLVNAIDSNTEKLDELIGIMKQYGTKR